VHLLGPREDLPRITAALDVACSSSRSGEAFPLVVGEAMASGVPCAVTDSGDSARLVNGLGRVVPIGDPIALGDAIASLLRLPGAERRDLGRAARAHVAEHYSLASVVTRYERLYEEIAAV
jgi:glycosyltransferase involved in cell wall biosynthesis